MARLRLLDRFYLALAFFGWLCVLIGVGSYPGVNVGANQVQSVLKIVRSYTSPSKILSLNSWLAG